MNITIHRGTHEIGGSCVEIENRDSRIVERMEREGVGPSERVMPKRQ